MKRAEIEAMIREAFKAGEQWGVTYSTWFIPTEGDTEDEIQKTISAILKTR